MQREPLMPDLGVGNYRGQDPLYEPLGALQSYKDAYGVAASPTASLLGLQPGVGGGMGPLMPLGQSAPDPGQLGQTPREAGQQRYHTGYQMPRRPQNQGMKAFVRQRLSLM